MWNEKEKKPKNKWFEIIKKDVKNVCVREENTKDRGK